MQEEAATWSVRNMTDRLEKLGVIASSDEWRAIGITRNRLAHDYPTNYAVHAIRVNDVLAHHAALLAAAASAQAYAQREGLLD